MPAPLEACQEHEQDRLEDVRPLAIASSGRSRAEMPFESARSIARRRARPYLWTTRPIASWSLFWSRSISSTKLVSAMTQAVGLGAIAIPRNWIPDDHHSRLGLSRHSRSCQPLWPAAHPRLSLFPGKGGSRGIRTMNLVRDGRAQENRLPGPQVEPGRRFRLVGLFGGISRCRKGLQIRDSTLRIPDCRDRIADCRDRSGDQIPETGLQIPRP